MKKHSFLCAVMVIALLFVLFSCEGEIASPVYTVTLDYDNGSDIVETQVPAGLKFIIPEVVPVKENYEFDHWLCNDVEYKPGAEIVINDNMKIKAVWKERAALKEDKALVTFVLNDKVIAEKTVVKGDTVSDPAGEYTSRSDYILDGWYLDGVKYDFSKPVTESITLTATGGRRIHVTYDAGSSELSKLYDVMEGTVLTKPDNPTRADCEFQYWYVPGNENTPYDFNTPVRGDEWGAFHLEAKWDRDYSTVTFNDGEESTSQQVYWGSTARIILDPLSSDDSKVFLGWFEDGSETSFNFDTKITKDTTLKAKWGDSTSELESDKVVVTYDMNDDSLTDRTITLNKGNSLSVLLVIDNPSDFSNKFFDYWQDESGMKFTTDNQFITVQSDKTFTAVWRDEVIIHFYPENGEKDSETTERVKIGSTVPEPAEPTRENSTFLGWYDGTNKFDFSSPTTGDFADIYLYAKYSPEYYLVTFDPVNDGDKCTKEVTWGNPVSVIADPKKDGYVFDGWYLGESLYDFSTSVKQNMKLTAHWIEEDDEVVTGRCVVTYDFGDSSIDNESFSFKSGSTVYLYNLANTAEKHPEGKILKEWLYADGTKAGYGGTTITGDILLKAVWTSRELSVMFTTGCDTTIESQRVAWGDCAAEPDVKLTRENSEFVCWKDATEKKYDFDTPVTDNLSLHASWNPESYTVTFNANNGNDKDSWTESISWGNTVGVPIDPVYSGMTFAGWYIDEEKEYDFSLPVKKDMTLTAHWVAEGTAVEGKYIVTYYFGEGIASKTVTVKAGTTIYVGRDMDIENYAYENHPEGMALDYWKDESGNEVGWSAVVVNESRTFTAVWKEMTVYVSFYSDGEQILQQKVPWGGSIEQQPECEKTGYNLKGWSLNPVDTEHLYDFSNTTVTPDDGYMNLYAIWEPAATYTVTINPDNGEETKTLTVIPGTILNLATPEKDHNRFKGWLNGETPFDTRTTGVTGDMVLTAEWEELDTFNVFFCYVDGKTASVTKTVDYGGKVEEQEAEGFESLVFNGWYKGDSVFDPLIFAGKPYDFANSTVTGDIYLYAKYNLKDEYVAGEWNVSSMFIVKIQNTDEEGKKTVQLGYQKGGYGNPSYMDGGGTWTFNSEDQSLNIKVSGKAAAFMVGIQPAFMVLNLGKTGESISACDFAEAWYTYRSKRTPAEGNLVGEWTADDDGQWTSSVEFDAVQTTLDFSFYSSEKKSQLIARTELVSSYQLMNLPTMVAATMMDIEVQTGFDDGKVTFSTSVTYAMDANTFYAVGFMRDTAIPFERVSE